MKRTLVYRSEDKDEPFELLKEGCRKGRKYSGKGAYNLAINMIKEDYDNFRITQEAKEKLVKFEEMRNRGFSTKLRNLFNKESGCDYTKLEDKISFQ
jgi:hypothetical protein